MAKRKNTQQTTQPKYNTDIENLHVTDSLFYGFAETMTDEQIDFCESIIHNNITFCDSVAGSGKTTMAVATAKLLYEHQLIDKLVYIVSPVETQTLGHLPGDVDDKIASYMGALHDALMEVNEFPIASTDKEHGWVTQTSHVYMRGINLKKSLILIDEAQNFTKSELKKVLTRISDDCHIVVIGHTLQCDLRKPEHSGFIPMMELFETLGKQNGLKVGNVKLTKNFRGIVSQTADMLDIN